MTDSHDAFGAAIATIASIITLANVVSFVQAVEARTFLGAEYHLQPRGPRRTF